MCGSRGEIASAQLELLLREHDDGAAFRRFVGERRELGDVGKFARVDAGRGMKRCGLAVAERDRSRLVEKQHVDIARRLDRAAGRGDHVRTDHPVHAGDTDRGEQPADGRRDQADQQRDQHGERHERALPGPRDA